MGERAGDLVDLSTASGLCLEARESGGGASSSGATTSGGSSVDVSAGDSGRAAGIGSNPEAKAAEGGTCTIDAIIVTVVKEEEGESRFVRRLHAGVVIIDGE